MRTHHRWSSCTNVASTTLIEKLHVPTKVHPIPYTLQWLKTGNEVTISRWALISFSVGPYCGVVLCDVLPMNACHILLGRPCLFDNHMMHDGHANTYALQFKGRSLTVAPLSPPKPLKIEWGREVIKTSTCMKYGWREPLVSASLYFPYSWLKQP